MINSEKVEDRCGVCGGNGSTCVDAASRFQVKHSVPGESTGINPFVSAFLVTGSVYVLSHLDTIL